MNKFLLILVLAATLPLTGCFEILEEVDLNDDGSGTLSLTINLSESKANLANYMKMKEVQGIRVPTQQEIEAEIGKIKKALASAKGISNVVAASDFEDFIFNIKGDFTNVKDLNNAINFVADAINRTPFETIKLDNYDYTTKAFRRYFNYPVTLLDYDQLPTMQRYMLETARIVSVYRFQKPIRTYTNEQAQVSASKKAIKLEQSVGALIKGDATIANSVIF
ncbi:MAG: hypothetical protein KDC43_01445 [Saprospiraceae bacterium]|nr:hypothetical protein [Saprospiraceae bacterium]MCB0622603.1 hypothetical protein [Saprospiraceae bacterium]MCB0680946.1 hypothetical protein [Saprospiraceae bacterium]